MIVLDFERGSSLFSWQTQADVVILVIVVIQEVSLLAEVVVDHLLSVVAHLSDTVSRWDVVDHPLDAAAHLSDASDLLVLAD